MSSQGNPKVAGGEAGVRKTPEEWLDSVEGTEKKCGRFKVFLGYAPGVGKTFSMLSEGIRRHSRGEDVVIGIVETHGRAGTSEVASQLEHVHLKPLEYKGTLFKEMDVDAIIARRPAVVLVDELAHTNVQGSRFHKRYEDIFALLEAKIDVLTTVNIQHIESLTPRVQALTGITVRETVPDWVLDRADEIVMSDLTPEALATRMRRGDVYPMERVERALSNFFRRGNLLALREMALQESRRPLIRRSRTTSIASTWARTGLSPRRSRSASVRTPPRATLSLVEQDSQGLSAEFFVVHLQSEGDLEPDAARSLEDNRQFAKNLGATVVELKGANVATATAKFAIERRITQAMFGRSALNGMKKYLYFYAISQFAAAAPHVDLHIITQEAA